MATAYDITTKQEGVQRDSGVPVVAVQDLCKTFDSHKVLNGITLRVNRGETLAVLGRSGTGKSVLLRLIIGLERPDTGSVRIHGQDIAGLALDRMSEIRKKIGFLFQHAALYDSLTVAENVAFPLEHHRRDMSKSERADLVSQLLAEVGLEGNLNKMPSDISGGMQKRVASLGPWPLSPRFFCWMSRQQASIPSVPGNRRPGSKAAKGPRQGPRRPCGIRRRARQWRQPPQSCGPDGSAPAQGNAPAVRDRARRWR